MKLLISLIAIACSASLACADGPRGVRGTIHVDGRDRTYRLHVPGKVNGKMPLVIALHGGSWQGAKMELVSQLDATANRHGFIVVYPDSMPREWADGRGTTKATLDGVDDVAFISALIDQLSKDYSIDPTRIYATGISNGGFMSYRLACELADRIAAIAPVAATMPVAQACKPSRPVPVLAIHGTDDPIVPYTGGEVHGGAGGKIHSVAESMKTWVDINGCDPTPVTSNVPDRAKRDGMRTHRDVYTQCKSGSDLVLYTIEKGGHTWPGGGYMNPKYVGLTTRDFDASELVWQFFARHAMPDRVRVVHDPKRVEPPGS